MQLHLYETIQVPRTSFKYSLITTQEDSLEIASLHVTTQGQTLPDTAFSALSNGNNDPQERAGKFVAKAQ
jgi:hypothetical protein